MNNVSLADIRQWAKKEGRPEKYKEFEKRLARKKDMRKNSSQIDVTQSGQFST
ncbi:MAG: hypothetical protein MUF22_04100 [Chitinispirillaceae bacterium]|jgi:hypothetical protein|nr:hypothetical protein [Chitinispirillaceae bacterium]